jgi:hypothetical protein
VELVNPLLLLGLLEIQSGHDAAAEVALERGLRLCGPDDDGQKAQLQYLLADVVLSFRHQRERAFALARAARAYMQVTPGQESNLAHLNAWFAEYVPGERARQESEAAK